MLTGSPMCLIIISTYLPCSCSLTRLLSHLLYLNTCKSSPFLSFIVFLARPHAQGSGDMLLYRPSWKILMSAMCICATNVHSLCVCTCVCDCCLISTFPVFSASLHSCHTHTHTFVSAQRLVITPVKFIDSVMIMIWLHVAERPWSLHLWCFITHVLSGKVSLSIYIWIIYTMYVSCSLCVISIKNEFVGKCSCCVTSFSLSHFLHKFH